MPNRTYHDHVAATLPLDRTAEIPAWLQSAAKKIPVDAFLRYLLNPSNIVAAGSDQSGATVLPDTHHCHFVATVPAGSGVKFAAQAAGIIGEGRLIRVSQSAADDCRLYPPSGGQINEQAVNTAILILRNQTLWFVNVSPTNWWTIP